MSRGGKRTGAGRPEGTGIFGEETKVIRVPASAIVEIKAFLEQRKPIIRQAPNDFMPAGIDIWKAHPEPSTVLRPLASHTVQAGFPSPADGYVEKYLDLNALLVDQTESTYFYRVNGLSMIGIGIYPGDILVVDRAKNATDGDIVIAILDGELTVKRLETHGRQVSLVAENKDYPPIVIRDGQELLIWGVVVHAIHSFRKRSKSWP
ncbi:MAG: translesion error-prone DNA polymerase V autoproteolytic subunit [Agitococcus sp.]|nr:translesion error-prone DNA polymerase V autoproteolytic subunit [Agitococcus sp.]